MTKEQLAKRVIDYVRMDIERGNISEYCPVGIAYTDYARAVKEDRSAVPQPPQAVICPHYYEATDGVHIVMVGRCKCNKGKLTEAAQ